MKKRNAERITKDLKVRKDGAVKGGWFNSVASDTIKSFGQALQTAARG